MKKKLLVMAGGTGGHVFPGIAVAEWWKEQGGEVAWLGTEHGLDTKLVPPTGIPFYPVAIKGLRGKGLKSYAMAPWKIFRAVTQSLSLMRKINPDVVLSMGGYVAGPGGVAAKLLRKPLVVHEQNAIPGATNTILAKFASKVLEAFPDSFPKKAKAEWVGNPVRKDILSIASPEMRFSKQHEKLKLLIIGGSQGAQKINNVLPKMLAMMDENHRPDVWHQAGAKHFDDVLSFYRNENIKGKVVSFIDNMAEAFSWADLIICRSGALTVSEIAAVGIGSILIPFTHAVDDHQTANANFLAKQKAAIIIQERDLTPEKLMSVLNEIISTPNAVLDMAKHARELAKPEATECVGNICLGVA
jgi:UDP-N-acetylglucosamine--N-acetylmuramyl-(pentapeptide) pyrophosphoryl-undecaprenol N-acetylglucosamine transferase